MHPRGALYSKAHPVCRYSTRHRGGQPQGDLRECNEDEDQHDLRGDEWHRTSEDRCEWHITCDPLDNEHVHADWRRDQTQFDHHHDDDSEPNRVVAPSPPGTSRWPLSSSFKRKLVIASHGNTEPSTVPRWTAS